MNSIVQSKSKQRYRTTQSEILEWISVVALVALSGCSFFTQAHRIETSVLLIVATALYCWNRHQKLLKKKLIILGVIFVSLATSFIANATRMTQANIADYALIIVSVVCITFLSSGMSLQSFEDKYVKIMCVICLISFICYYIQLNNLSLVYQLGKTNIVQGYIVSWYHTWGWTYIFNRNAGPFWEPGAFQGYIFLAILFILNTRRIREHYISLAILTIGVITTMSTTGYALLAIIAVYFTVVYWKSSLKGSGGKIWAMIRILVVLILAVYLIRYVVESNVISNKLTSENQSFAIRMLDLRTGLRIAMQRPLFGFGIGSPSLIDAISAFGMIGNSVGIFSILQYFGMFLGTAYIFINFYWTCKVYNSLNPFVIIVCFAILHLTEGLLLFPVYMCLLFFTYSSDRRNSFI